MRVSLLLFVLLICLAKSVLADDLSSKRGLTTEKPTVGPYVEIGNEFMQPYTMFIPGTDVTIEMIPVAGGLFEMGSSEDEASRSSDEGPQFEVLVDPVWVAKTETNWAQYKEFMKLYPLFTKFQAAGERLVKPDNLVDAVSAPTELYDPSFTFEQGEDPRQPAVTMTQYAAQQFTKWLSLVSGDQYRLPTEAEWEYVARGGTTSAYSWGNSAADADAHAWYFGNTHVSPFVGTKLPNPFGLHDVHGSVAEWTVGQYTPSGYSEFASKEPVNALDVVKWPTESVPGVVRGGTWESDPELLRSAARMASNDEKWKSEDPCFPNSPWWFTSDPSRGVGFRIFRSYEPLSKEAVEKFWEPTSRDVQSDVQFRLDEGRGILGIVDRSLPDAIKLME